MGEKCSCRQETDLAFEKSYGCCYFLGENEIVSEKEENVEWLLFKLFLVLYERLFKIVARDCKDACCLIQEFLSFNIIFNLYVKAASNSRKRGYSFFLNCFCGPCGAAVERWTGNREVPGSNLDRCTVIFPTTPTW